jgi:hypothetical protein
MDPQHRPDKTGVSHSWLDQHYCIVKISYYVQSLLGGSQQSEVMQQSVKICQHQAMNEGNSAVNVVNTRENVQWQFTARDCLLLYSSVSFISHFLLRNIKMKINRTKILPSILFGFETFVSHTEGRTKADGVQEEGAAEDTWG